MNKPYNLRSANINGEILVSASDVINMLSFMTAEEVQNAISLAIPVKQERTI